MTYEEIKTRLDSMTIAQIIEWLNGDGKDATAEQAGKVVNVLNEKVTESNTASQKDRMTVLFQMERNDFWKSYAINPYYAGKKVSNTPENGYQVQDVDIRIKFRTLEKAYQEHTKSKASTICAFGQWDIAVTLFNYWLQNDLLSEGKGVVSVQNGINKDKLNKALANMPECFKSNSKQNRILMLKHIVNLMCGEELGAKPMSFDVKYIKICVAKAKNGSIKTLSDWALTDEIVTVIGKCLNVDEEGKRKSLYDFNNKGGFAEKKSK